MTTTNSTSEREQRLRQIRDGIANGWLTCGVAPNDPRMVQMKFETSEAAKDFVDRMANFDLPLSLLDSEAAGTNYLHHPQFPMNGTELECDGEELRPDGMCAKCERVNERIEAKITTARQGERRAAFREAIATAKRFDYGETPKCLKCKIASEIIDAIEAAANESLTREDRDDG